MAIANEASTKEVISSIPEGHEKRRKLEVIASHGINMRRANIGKLKVIELYFPDTGGYYEVVKIHSGSQLDHPSFLARMHSVIHGNDGLDGLRERVWGPAQ